jgi:hypothetical protein
MVSAESQPRFRRLLQISLTQAKTGPATKKEKPMSSRYRIWIIAAVTIVALAFILPLIIGGPGH